MNLALTQRIEPMIHRGKGTAFYRYFIRDSGFDIDRLAEMLIVPMNPTKILSKSIIYKLGFQDKNEIIFSDSCVFYPNGKIPSDLINDSKYVQRMRNGWGTKFLQNMLYDSIEEKALVFIFRNIQEDNKSMHNFLDKHNFKIGINPDERYRILA